MARIRAWIRRQICLRLGPWMKQVGLKVRQELSVAKETNLGIEYSKPDCYMLGCAPEGREEQQRW